MNKIHVCNVSASAIFVGSIMVPPGETRLFEPHEVPPEYRTAAPDEAAPEASENPLLVLSELPISRLALGLPALTDDELDQLEILEQQKDKPRAGALAEITAERLRRAESTTPGGLPPDEAGEGGE